MTEWNQSWDDEDPQYQYNQRPYGQRANQPGWLGKMLTLDDAMHTEIFRVVEEWATQWLGVDGLGGYLGAHQILMPVGVYTQDKLKWLNNKLTNSIKIDSRLQQAKTLQQWVDKQSLAYYCMNGTPYRRGYLLYGPPGTGKTSLAQAIVSDYDLELFEIKLAKMRDSKLQNN